MSTGAASGLIAVSDDAGIPLAETQKELTPLQRLVIQKELKRRQEEMEEERSGGGGHGQIQNSHPQAGQQIQGETIEYVNEGAKDG